MCYWRHCLINVTCWYSDFKYCQYLYKNFKKTVVGIRGMDEYIYNANKWKCMAGLGIQTRDPCVTRKVFYHWATCIQAN